MRPLNPQTIARLKARMLVIPERLKAAAHKSLEASAEKLAAEIRAGVPVDQGDLRDSVRIKDLTDDSGIGFRVVAGNRKAFYAAMVEHGTSRSAAQPFFFPVYRRNKRAMRARLGRDLKVAIQQPGGK